MDKNINKKQKLRIYVFFAGSWVRAWHPPEKKKDAITDRSRSMLLIEHYKQCNQPGFTETNEKLDMQSLSAVLYHNGDADVRIVGLVTKI